MPPAPKNPFAVSSADPTPEEEPTDVFEPVGLVRLTYQGRGQVLAEEAATHNAFMVSSAVLDTALEGLGMPHERLDRLRGALYGYRPLSVDFAARRAALDRDRSNPNAVVARWFDERADGPADPD